MKTIIAFIISFCFIISAKSQQTALAINGQITDSVNHQPINFATIVLNTQKKVQVKSVLSAKDGSFIIPNLSSGEYLISVIHVGYQTKTMKVSLNSTAISLGKISLQTGSTQLKGVSITADKPLVKQEIDRIAYNVQADPESKVSNVLEMMRKVPLLSVDGNDDIQLQGNTNYKILINGKPSGMMERNPKDILKSMPASSIERIEVITTPPAKYDGEGLAGIINIITFRKVDNGTNGTVNINQRFPVGGPGIGGTFTAKSGKFGIATNAGGSLNSSPILNNSNSRLTQGINATNLWQAGTQDQSGKSGYAGVELSFEVDTLNLISGQFSYNANRNESANTQLSSLKNAMTLLQSYELTNDLNSSGNGIDASLNYQLSFKKDKNRILTFSYRYYNFSNKQFNNVDIFNTFDYNISDYRQDNIGGSKEQTAQIDLVYPLKKLMVEAGAKAIFRDNNSDFQYLTESTSGSFIVDPLRSNVFDNQQNVYSLYNTYQFNWKDWSIKAGLRAELTEINADFSSSTIQIDNNSLNVMPSISLMRKFKNMSSLNLGWSSRIQRPGINQLNPFVDRSNPNFESSGNPNLKATTGNSFEVNYGYFKKLTVNVSLRAIIFNDLVMPKIVTDPITNITRSSYGNTGNATLMGLGVNLSYPFSNKLKASLGAMANYGMVNGEINGVILKTRGLMRRANTSLSYRPSKTWQATASMNYNGPNLSLQGTSNSFVTSTFSAGKDFLDGKLSVSVAINNAFNKYRDAINFTNGPNFTQESYNQNYQRNFTTSLNYRFGKLKESIKKNKKGINNTDVSSGSSL